MGSTAAFSPSPGAPALSLAEGFLATGRDYVQFRAARKGKVGALRRPDPSSVKFCHKIGLTDVSSSPFRVPVARLAAAQAAIEEERARTAQKTKKK
jgi:hypothetical protein